MGGPGDVNQVGRLRAAIVGAGLMGRWHAFYAARARADVAAIIDPNAAAAAVLQRQHAGAQLFAGLAECLADCPVDVVHICTGTESHVALTEVALRAGKHVLVEKPAAPSVEETERLVHLARTHGVGLNVVHQLPFQHAFQRVLREREQLGELVRVSHNVCTAGGTGRRDAERRQVLVEVLPHPFSLFWALLGDRLRDATWTALGEGDELAAVGKLGDLHLHVWLSLRGRPPCNELVVVGTQATAHVDLFHGYRVLEPGSVTRAAKVLRPFTRAARQLLAAGWNLARRTARWEPAYPGLGGLIAQFYHAVSHGGPAPISEAELVGAARWSEELRSLSTPGLYSEPEASAKGRA